MLLQTASYRKSSIIKRNRKEKKYLNIVITGGGRGLGKHLCNEFFNAGDHVHTLVRRQSDVDAVLQNNHHRLTAHLCDVSNPNELRTCLTGIKNDFVKSYNSKNQDIDIVVCNAANSGGYRQFKDIPDKALSSIIGTNLLATSITCKVAHEIMMKQQSGGAIFNVNGAGSDGAATLGFSAYGSTKAAVSQLTKTLQNEWKNDPVQLHTISPGMMSTMLLTENLPTDTMAAIEFIVSKPEQVASFLVPKIRKAYFNVDQRECIRYLTILRAIGKLFRLMDKKSDS